MTNDPRHGHDGGVPIFYYHRIGPLTAGELSRRLTVTPDRFGFQMWLMAKLGYRTISMDELADALEAGEVPRKRFVISFDDGFADLYQYAMPFLERHGFTAIVYLVTSRIGQTDRWDEGLGFPLQPLLGWDQIRSMAERRIEIGSHTCSHSRLTEVNAARLAEELGESKKIIEDGLQKPVRHFCYPYGAHDGRVIEAVHSAGYRTAVTTLKRRAKAGANVLALPRVKISKGTGNVRFCLNLAFKY